MTTYNSTIEAEVKTSARGSIPGGASTLAENISQTVIDALVSEYSQDDINETWPEYASGISYPSWVDDVILHVSASSASWYNGGSNVYGQGNLRLGIRVQARQITTNIHETQILGTPSPYGPPPQVSQYNFRAWQQ